MNDNYTFLKFDVGCIKNVRIGNHQTILSRPTVRENVLDGCNSLTECQSECPSNSECVTEWGDSHCECLPGFVGPLCVPVCSVNPCEHHSQCVEDTLDRKGYNCKCNSTDYSGTFIETSNLNY